MLIGKKRKPKRGRFMQGNNEIQRRVEAMQWNIKHANFIIIEKGKEVNKLEIIRINLYNKKRNGLNKLKNGFDNEEDNLLDDNNQKNKKKSSRKIQVNLQKKWKVKKFEITTEKQEQNVSYKEN
jgi:hypothetical protein